MKVIDLSNVQVSNLGLSQKGQDSLLDYVFSNYVNPSNEFCVEFGAVDGYVNSNTFYFRNKGWNCLLIDNIYHRPDISLYKYTLTAENICYIFEKHSVPADVDLISIDVDGNDYWLLKAVLEGGYRPRVIMIEANVRFDHNVSMVQAYDPSYIWNGKDWYGASPLAIKKLIEADYLIAHIHIDDIILIRKSALDGNFKSKDLNELYIPNLELYESHNSPDTYGSNWINV